MLIITLTRMVMEITMIIKIMTMIIIMMIITTIMMMIIIIIMMMIIIIVIIMIIIIIESLKQFSGFIDSFKGNDDK